MLSCLFYTRLSFFLFSFPFFSIRIITPFPILQLLFKYKECDQFKENSNKLKAQFLLISSSFLSLRTLLWSRFLYTSARRMRRGPPKYYYFFKTSLCLVSTKWAINVCLRNAHQNLKEQMRVNGLDKLHYTHNMHRCSFYF